jgi:hypothetical protein
LVELIIKPGGPEAGSKMALLDKELEVFADKRGRMDRICSKFVSSSMKKKIVQIILIGLFLSFYAIPIVCHCLNQPKIFPKPIAHALLFFFR